ncbi:MAG TPA: SRPBCC family protein [Longimicrobium sp.]|nr:SRPBCC family protein [Longimicrobium sp.]
MPTLYAAGSAEIDAPPHVVYDLIADYREGHVSILPPIFLGIDVEQGGRGAGTIATVRTRTMGIRRDFRIEVEEPEPGRVLVETDLATGTATSFTVDPLDGGARCRVTIETAYQARGVMGFFERFFIPRVLRGIYAAELRSLAARAKA